MGFLLGTLKYFDEWKLMALDKIKGAFTYDVRCRGGFKMLTVADKGGLSLADVSNNT